jgi:hypothetical protein
MTLADDANLLQARLPFSAAPMVSIGLAAVAASMALGISGRSLR